MLISYARALHDALEPRAANDTLIVWKLDRLARSMKQLIETVETLLVRSIGFRSLTEALDTTTAKGGSFFTYLARWRNSSAAQSESVPKRALSLLGAQAERGPSTKVDRGRPSLAGCGKRHFRGQWVDVGPRRGWPGQTRP